MCTLDVMGYTDSQMLTVPYLVLCKSLEKADIEKKEIYTRISKLVLDTCQHILKFNEHHRNQIITSVQEFYTKPEQRTADAVPSIKLLLTQLYVLASIPDY